MFIFTYTAAVLTLFFVGTAAFLLLKGKRDVLTYIFILYVMANALWIGGNAAADISRTPFTLILWSSIAFVASAFIVSFFLMFVDTFVDDKLPSTERIILYFLPSILLTIFSFSDYAVLDTMFPEGEPAQIVPGVHYYFFLIFLFGGLSYLLSRLISHYKKTRGAKRLQTLYITIGFLALFIGGVTFGIILPLLGELRFYNVAPQFSFITAVVTTYAIFKHHLLDIRIVIQRGLIYTFLLLGVVGMYLLILQTITVLFGNNFNIVTTTISAITTTILGIFSVQHIDRYLRKMTDALFFKDHYDYRTALYALSDSISRKLVLADIITQTERELQSLFKATHVYIHVFDTQDIYEENPLFLEQFESPTFPIRLGNIFIGRITLGQKLSGDLYTFEDVSLLRTFTNQVAVAVENARLFKVIEDYSIELERRVEARTHEVTEVQAREKQLLLDLSHNLQNRLTVIKGQLATIVRELGTSALCTLEESIDNTSVFIYDLLHFSQLEAHEQRIEKEQLLLSELVTTLTESYTIIAEASEVKLISLITPNIYMLGNAAKLKELFDNLVSNAIKYIGNGSIRNVTVCLYQDEAGIQFSVEDTGMGIHEDDLPHIFDRFYRSNNETNLAIPGTGLGLAISKRIADIHGGSIRATSIYGRGTCITVTFPIFQR